MFIKSCIQVYDRKLQNFRFFTFLNYYNRLLMVEYFLYIFNIYTWIALQKKHYFFLLGLLWGVNKEKQMSLFFNLFWAKQNHFLTKKDIFYKNLYFNIEFRTSVSKKWFVLFTLSKLTEKWQKHRILENGLKWKNSVFFLWACDFAVGKQLFCIFYLDNLYTYKINLNEMMCDPWYPTPYVYSSTFTFEYNLIYLHLMHLLYIPPPLPA